MTIKHGIYDRTQILANSIEELNITIPEIVVLCKDSHPYTSALLKV